MPVRTLWVTAAVAGLLGVGGWGCAEASESVSADRDRVTTRATRATPTSPLAAPSSAKGPATSSSLAAPILAAPVTSGGGGGGGGSAGSVPGVVAASVTSPPTTSVTVAPTVAVTKPAAVAVPLGEVSLSSVACGGHDDGDWVVFRLDGTAVNATAGYGTSPVAVTGDRTVVVTLTPTFDRVTSTPSFSGCRYVTDIQRAGAGSGSASWVIGVQGEPRITTVEPGPAGDSFAYVVKIRG